MRKIHRVALILSVYSIGVMVNGLPNRLPYGIIAAVILAVVVPYKERAP